MQAFDTLQVSKELQTAFTPDQAETLVRVFAQAFGEELATKQDLAQLEARLHSDINDVRNEINDVRNEIKDAKVEMIKWTVGAIAFNLLGTAGLMITLIKTIPH